MSVLKCLPYEDDDGESELLWVKAGEPGEKPTIIRQLRSESSTSSSSRDNSGGSSCNRKNLLTVENGTVFRTNDTNGTRTTTDTSSDSLNTITRLGRTSSNDSHVIVVNISEQIYPAHVDRQRIQRWRDLHSPRASKKLPLTEKSSLNNNSNINNNKCSSHSSSMKTNDIKRPLSQPIRPLSNTSPKIERCASSSSPFNRVKTLRNDEGYTSLSEDCKDSDTESVRSKSLPSSWRPSYLNQQRQERNMLRYAQRMTSNADADVSFIPCEENGLLENNTVKLSHQKRSSSVRHHIENVIEICTCFVCLRSAIYHTQDEDDTDSLVEHPCSCDAPSLSCCGRWCAISVLICFLPFLIFYPPLKCCLSIHDYRKKKRRKKKEKKLLKKKNNTMELQTKKNNTMESQTRKSIL